MPKTDVTPDPLLAAIGRRVRDRRKAIKMTQAELGAASDLAQQFVWRVENGRQNLEIRTLARLSLALNTTMEALVAGVRAGPGTIARRARTKDVHAKIPTDGDDEV